MGRLAYRTRHKSRWTLLDDSLRYVRRRLRRNSRMDKEDCQSRRNKQEPKPNGSEVQKPHHDDDRNERKDRSDWHTANVPGDSEGSWIVSFLEPQYDNTGVYGEEDKVDGKVGRASNEFQVPNENEQR